MEPGHPPPGGAPPPPDPLAHDAGAASASSSTGPASSKPAIAGGESIEMQPNAEHCSLDWSPFLGRYVLINKRTTERVALAAGTWEMTSDEGGFAVLGRFANDDDSEPEEAFEAADLFKDNIFWRTHLPVGDIGREVLVRSNADSDHCHADIFALYAQRFEEHYISWELGPCNSKIDHLAAVLRVERHGSKVWWRLQDVHSVCSLQSLSSVGGGASSTWVQKRLPKWQAFVLSLGLGEAVRRGRGYGDETVGDGARDLPWPAANTIGLLAILLRATFASQHQGGLAKESDRAATKEYLRSLVVNSHLRGDWTLHLYLRAATWSMPGEVSGEASLPIRVGKNGMVDGAAFRLSANSPSELKGLVDMLCRGLNLRPAADLESLSMPITDFLMCVVASAEQARFANLAKSIWAQVCIQLALGIDHVIHGVLAEDDEISMSNGIWVESRDLDYHGNRKDRVALCLGYLRAGIEQAEVHQQAVWSLTTDATRVGNKNIYTTAVLFSSNIGFFLPEVPDFVGREETSIPSSLPGDRKALTQDWCRRARAWATKCMKGRSWRTAKKKRVKAFVFLKSLDHQLRVGCQQGGLAMFQQKEAIAERPPDALSWPCLVVSSDCGGDLWASWMFAMRDSKMNLNLELCPDLNHCAWNAARAALRSAGLWPSVLMNMLVANMRHGPFGQGMRFCQLSEALGSYLRCATPFECPLFASLLPKMLRDTGREEETADRQIQETLWSELADAVPWRARGSAVNLNRWFGVLREMRSEDAVWHQRLIVMFFCCLELDMLKGSKLDNLLRVRGGENGEEGAARELMKDLSAEQRRLQAASCNMLVNAALVYSDPENPNRARLVERMCRALEKWHQDANKTLRDVWSVKQWLTAQFEGAGLNVIRDTSKLFNDREFLRFVGLEDSDLKAECESVDSLRVLKDDDLSSHMGKMLLGLAHNFLGRELWRVRGWPIGLVRIMSGGDGAQQAVDWFRGDYQRFLLLKEQVREHGEPLRDLCRRSCFHTVCVQQVVAYLESVDWRVTEDFVTWVGRKYRNFMQSQAAEDAFNVCRKVERSSMNMSAKPEACYAALASQRILANRHSYYEIDAKVYEQPFGKGCDLPDNLWRYQKDYGNPEQELPLKRIIGTSESPEWWTCQPDKFMVQHADLELLAMHSDLEGSAQWSERLQKVWLGFFLNAPILLRKKAEGRQNKWCFAAGDILGSASIVIPAKQVYIGDNASSAYFEADIGDQIEFMAITDLAEVEAMTYIWVSPGGQWARHPDQRPYGYSAFAAVRALCTSEPTALLELACRNAFWEMPAPQLKKLAQYLRVAGAGNQSSLFDTTMALISHGLQCDENQALDLIAQRMARMAHREEPCAVETAGLEEGVTLFDRDEQQEVRKAQKEFKAEAATVERFAFELAEKRSALAPKAKRRKAAAKQSVPTSTIDQARARALCPPKSFIWRNLRDGGWAGHCPPYKRVSALWAIHGEHGAMLHVLRLLWRQHLQYHGLPPSACTVAGLLDGVAQEGAASSGSGAACSRQ